jgi:hypothetical protein
MRLKMIYFGGVCTACFISAMIGIVLLLCGCTKTEKSNKSFLFEHMPSNLTGVNFRNDLKENDAFNIIQFLYFYNGGGVAAGDVNNDGLADLYFTSNQGSNRLYLNSGNFRFEDVTEKAGVAGSGMWKTGVTMVDINNDGWLDIYVCQVGNYKSIKGRNQLFVNNQDGTFSEQAKAYGIDFQGFSTQAAFFDMDADGDLDLYLLNHSVHAAENYGPASIRTRRDLLAGDRLYRNDKGFFNEIGESAGIYASRIGYGLGVATSDLNNDGLPDIYVANDFHENDYLYYNKGNGKFEEALTASLAHTSNFSMGCDIADINNDALPDIFSLDMKPAEEKILKRSAGTDPHNIFKFKLSYGYHYQFPRNMLHLNLGPCESGIPRFSEIGQFAGVAATDWSWASLFFDMDNDGWKDLFISNGIRRRLNDLDYLNFISGEQVQQNATDLEMARRMPDGAIANFAFQNKGDLRFDDVSNLWGLDLKGYSNGAAYVDLDNDGDLDLVVNNLDAVASVYQNHSNSRLHHAWLSIQFEGEGANTQGIGAKVIVFSNGNRQMQEHFTTRGFQSSVAPGLHFGFGEESQIDSVLVVWPDKRYQILKNVSSRQRLTLRQSEAQKDKRDYWSQIPKAVSVVKNVTASSGINFVHRENPLTDFDREKLMPFMTSTPGPRIATGDFNGDGLQDFFICGAHRQPGELYRQTADGEFQRVPSLAIAQDSLFEDADACWFDADLDGDLDLFIASGGGEYFQMLPESFVHRLYLNDGKGNFERSANEILPTKFSASCVVPFDYDNDGLLDIFIGGHSFPYLYGVSPPSLILRNEGGRFRNVSDEVWPELESLGMVTDAVWDSVNRSLWVTGLWMPIIKTTFEQKKAKMQAMPNTEGWWSALALWDKSGNGERALLAGNWGLNSEFNPSPTEPAELFVSDFDDNGSTDPILSYYKSGRKFSYFGKDELSRQMVRIKKDYTDYESFANANFEEIFSKKLLKKIEGKKAVTLASSLFQQMGKDQYSAEPMPWQCQISAIGAIAVADLNLDGFDDAVILGNFTDVQPAIGNMDASPGYIWWGGPNGGFAQLCLTGQYRSVAIIPLKNGKNLILCGQNNGKLEVLQPEKIAQ